MNYILDHHRLLHCDTNIGKAIELYGDMCYNWKYKGYDRVMWYKNYDRHYQSMNIIIAIMLFYDLYINQYKGTISLQDQTRLYNINSTYSQYFKNKQ